MRRTVVALLLITALLVTSASLALAAPGKNVIGINVLLNTDITDAILADLATHGKLGDMIYEIDALTMKAPESELAVIQALPYVAVANPDAVRTGAPVDTLLATDFFDGLSTWDLDAINVTDFGFDNRQVAFDGTGVYVAVLDTGLLDSWRQYFPQERIAVEYAKSFGGGGSESAAISEQPNKWEHDQSSHGTHVTSTILGYQRTATLKFNGVAPLVKVIPVKVLNQNGSGSSFVIAQAVVYVANLKAEGGPLAGHPVVINESLGGPALEAVEQAAIDYAVSKGVIIVASAGNSGPGGMGYPGAYAPVISAAASGWTGEWTGQRTDPTLVSYYRYWWYLQDVPDPINPDEFYITSFSAHEGTGQDLDVAAPGSWVVGPYQVNSGQTSYYFLGGTSMAAPHVTGTVALMLQKNPTLTAAQAEAILEGSAVYLEPDCRDYLTPAGTTESHCWAANETGAGLLDAAAALAATP